MAVNNSKFKQGDLVVLKSGGPVMTVSSVNFLADFNEEGKYRCKWFSGKKLELANFSEPSLVLADEDKGKAKSDE